MSSAGRDPASGGIDLEDHGADGVVLFRQLQTAGDFLDHAGPRAEHALPWFVRDDAAGVDEQDFLFPFALENLFHERFAAVREERDARRAGGQHGEGGQEQRRQDAAGSDAGHGGFRG
jgi:hypothetical protein